MKAKILIAGAIVALITTLFLSNRNLSRENLKLDTNNTELLENLDSTNLVLHINDSITARKVLKLEMSVSEAKKTHLIDENLLSDMDVKYKRLKSYSETQIRTVYVIDEVMRDSIVYRGDTAAVLKKLKYKTAWIDIQGILDLATDSIKLKVINKESLIYTEFYEPRIDWWIFKMGNKRVDQVILSKNPNTIIEKAIFLEMKR